MRRNEKRNETGQVTREKLQREIGVVETIIGGGVFALRIYTLPPR